MKVLLDNNLSHLVARAIDILVKAEDDEVVSLREKFPPNTPDADWIGVLGREGGWVVISGDVRITKRPAERAAWRSTDLVGFFLAPGWSDFKNTEKAARLLLWWPKVRAQAALVQGGAMFQVPINPSSKLKQLQVERR